MIRLDSDRYSKLRIRPCYRRSSLFSILNEEINQIPAGLYLIERLSNSRTKRHVPIHNDEGQSTRSGVLLQCKLLNKSNPIVPSLRLYVSSSYPEQAPEILSLTKTTPPRLEFAGSTFTHCFPF